MRYYSINIEDAPPVFGTGLGEATYTSFVGGRTLPNAWNVELDIPSSTADSPMGGAGVRIWGISINEISQAADLAALNKQKKIKIFGGMQRGLPLANPAQAGLLFQGYIYQAFGNWVGTEMTLDLVCQPGEPPRSEAGGTYSGGGTGAYDRPINLTLDWKKGATLGAALENTLKTAFPTFQITNRTSQNLVYSADQPHIAQTVTQLGQWAKQFSRGMIKDANYMGVSISIFGNTITIFDGSQTGGAAEKQIAFTDLIGQPTWIEPLVVQIKCVMRTDIKIFDTIRLPQTSVINTANAMSSLVPNQRLAFQGTFTVLQSRSLGNFRQPDANSWVTIINATPTLAAAPSRQVAQR